MDLQKITNLLDEWETELAGEGAYVNVLRVEDKFWSVYGELSGTPGAALEAVKKQLSAMPHRETYTPDELRQFIALVRDEVGVPVGAQS